MSSCPCDENDSLKNLKKGLIFAVIQRLIDTKIIHSIEKPIEGVESGKIAKGKIMKLNIMMKTIIYIVTSYVIDMFKYQLLKLAVQSPMLKDKIIKDEKACFCILEDLILVLVLQIISFIYHKRFKGKDLLNNIISVYGTSFLYDMYGRQYLRVMDKALPFAKTDEKTSTSTTNQGGENRVNTNQETSRIGKRSL